MAIINLPNSLHSGIKYDVSVDDSADYVDIDPETTFFDVSLDRVFYKDAAGNIKGVFDGGADFDEVVVDDVSPATKALLENDANWSGGLYIGAAITDTLHGQEHYDNFYFFKAVANNSWVRLSRFSESPQAGLVGIIDGAGGHVFYDSLWEARDAAVVGDKIEVFPGSWLFDNTSNNLVTSGFDFNKLNLWKNGVTWVFNAGVNIKFINSSPSGPEMALFRPPGDMYTTCSVLGALKFEQQNVGGDSSNGQTHFFRAQHTSGTDLGYEFYAVLESIVSYSGPFILIDRINLDTIPLATVKIKTNYMFAGTAGGNVASGGAIDLAPGIGPLDCYIDIGHFYCGAQFAFYLRGTWGENTNMRVYGKEARALVYNLFYIRGISGSKFKYDVDNSYVTIPRTSFGLFGAAVTVGGGLASPNNNMIFNSNFIDLGHSSSSVGMFHFTNTANSKYTIIGDIQVKTITGSTGKFVSSLSSSSLSEIHIIGNIIYEGLLNTFVTLATYDNGKTLFKGKIRGNFGGQVAWPINNGVVTITGSEIDFTEAGVSTANLIGKSGSTAIGYFNFINSLYKSKSEATLGVVDGNYSHLKIHNSVIQNNGTSRGIYTGGADANSVLDITNSMVLTQGASIDYPGASIVNAEFVVTRVAHAIVTLNGAITLNANLNFLP